MTCKPKKEKKIFLKTHLAHNLCSKFSKFATSIYEGMRKSAFIFDGRNLLDKKEMTTIGFEYSSIGK